VSRHDRRSIRLPHHDYATFGAYFVTICTMDRQHLFGGVDDGVMILNEAGELAAACWQNIPAHFPHARLDEWVVMPNHVHGIIHVTATPGIPAAPDARATSTGVGAKNFSPLHRISPTRTELPTGTSRTIGSMVRGFKIGVTNWFRHHSIGREIWQRNYWEHLVRTDDELERTRTYITDNPKNWTRDGLNAGPP
jgi:REP element-mobilizing transposase RayT